MQYTAALLALAAAVRAHPLALPQGVTSAVAPSASAPSGCTGFYSCSFGIAVRKPTSASPSPSSPTPTSSSSSSAIHSAAESSASIVSQISDGQPQGPTAPAPISQISDGQPQAPTNSITTLTITNAPVTQISDGQVQAPTATTAAPVTQISDGQIQAPPSTLSVSTISVPVSQISDGQVQAPTSTPGLNYTKLVHAMQNAWASHNRRTIDPPERSLEERQNAVTCQTNATLTLTLANGVLKDTKGRTGYIASNFQFQFDDPPQAGALYTSGFTVCSNGSLALGGSAVWWQCTSGSFYNLYDRWWADQCEPVILEILKLQDCSS